MKLKSLFVIVATSASMLLAGCSFSDNPVYNITLDKNSIELVKNGSGVQLNATVSANTATFSKEVVWTVENPAVATVDSVGYVVGVGGGMTNVYAACKANQSVMAVCAVSVLDHYTVDSVVLSRAAITMDISSTGEKIDALVTGTAGVSQAVIWTTNPTGIVAVSETGVITPLTPGATEITATSVADRTKSAKAQVTVTGAKEVREVTLEPTSFELDINGTKTKQLTATVVGTGVTQNVSYSIDKPSVASVSSTGLVTAKAVGTAVVTATSVDDPTKSAIASLNVKDSSVGNLVVNPSATTLDVYNNKTITLTVSNGTATAPAVTWKTSDSTVASVNTTSGRVTAKKAGSAVVTATLKSDTGVTATCAVTVTDSTPVVTKVTLSQNTLNLDCYNNKTATLTATVEGKFDYATTVTWSTNNSTVASVSNGVVTAKAKGTAVITATSTQTTSVKATCTVIVTDSAPIEITLDKSTGTIGVGKTMQLTATVTHYQSDSSVNWSTSKSSVATVSNSGVVTGVAAGTAVITATSKEDGTKSDSCTVTVSETISDKWTIMIYMCGADLESDHGYATGDIKEILSVAGQPDDVNILIQTGGASSWRSTYGISSSYNQRWHVENKTLKQDNSNVYTSYQSMGSSSTLKDYLVWGIDTYPADKIGLIFWNHGGGMDGVCYDQKKSNDNLTNSEVKSALSGAFTTLGRSEKLEFIGYDACLMQVQDVAEFNSTYANYMVASEESEAGEGWDYDTWIDDVYADKSTDTILKAICDGFIKSIDDSGYINDQTLSYLNLNYMSSYKAAWESMATALKSKVNSSNKTTFANWVVKNVKTYAEDGEDSNLYYSLFDAKDFVNKISSNTSYNPGSTYTSNVLSAFSNLVAYSAKGSRAGNSNGLTMFYACSSSYSRYYSGMYNSSETSFTNWMSFNSTGGYL